MRNRDRDDVFLDDTFSTCRICFVYCSITLKLSIAIASQSKLRRHAYRNYSLKRAQLDCFIFKVKNNKDKQDCAGHGIHT